MGRPLRRCTAAMVLVALTAACSSGGKPATQNTSTPSPSPSTTGIVVLKLGERQATAKGNVTVYAYDGSVPATTSRQPALAGDVFVAFDVEGCAGSSADQNTGVTARQFYLQLDLKHPPYNPVDPVKQPALHDTALAPGRCARGWITFEIPASPRPQFVLFRGRPATAWRVPPR